MTKRDENEVPEVMPEFRREQRSIDLTADLSPAELRALNIKSAPAWVPSPGQVLIGTVVAIDKASITNEYGEQVYPRVIYELSDGRFVAVHALGTVVFNQYKALRTKPGDKNILRAGEERTSAKGKTYKEVTIVNADTLGTDSAHWSDEDWNVDR